MIAPVCVCFTASAITLFSGSSCLVGHVVHRHPCWVGGCTARLCDDVIRGDPGGLARTACTDVAVHPGAHAQQRGDELCPGVFGAKVQRGDDYVIQAGRRLQRPQLLQAPELLLLQKAPCSSGSRPARGPLLLLMLLLWLWLLLSAALSDK